MIPVTNTPKAVAEYNGLIFNVTVLKQSIETQPCRFGTPARQETPLATAAARRGP
jgi:hypothetical protein